MLSSEVNAFQLSYELKHIQGIYNKSFPLSFTQKQVTQYETQTVFIH